MVKTSSRHTVCHYYACYTETKTLENIEQSLSLHFWSMNLCNLQFIDMNVYIYIYMY